jgi:hypothetical protein
MSAKPATKVLSGSTEVVTAQTPVQLVTSAEAREIICNAVHISVPASNVGTLVAVGGSKTSVEAKKEAGKEKGLLLEKAKGTVLRIETSDPSQIWVDVETSKDRVNWLLELA